MNIYVEAMLILAPLGFWAAWLIFEIAHKKFRLWRYKPENDKGRLGEEHRRELVRKGGSVGGRESRPLGFTPTPERTLLQAAASELEGEGSFGFGKTSDSDGTTRKKFFRNPFTRK